MPIKIVVTGPESTGKTSLCTQLSERYKGTMIPEFSREYLTKTMGFYELDDIEIIGLTQCLHNKQFGEEKNILFCDSDALTCYIWALEKYKIDSDKLKKAFYENLPDLYLLCCPDLKWEHDVLRESPDDLEHLFGLFLKQIVGAGAAYSFVYGVGRIRETKAAFSINSRFPELVGY